MMSSHNKKVILALDVGSSSVRCTAYTFDSALIQNEDHANETNVHAIEGCSSSRPMRIVQPNTGKILFSKAPQEQNNDSNNTSSSSLLDEIDACVDSTLEKLRNYQKFKDSSGFEVAGVGFSTFVMNLVGVNEHGEIVDGATLSYACNSSEVAEACRSLRGKIGPDGLERLHQRTGCMLHSAYALPQLRQFYSKQQTIDDTNGVINPNGDTIDSSSSSAVSQPASSSLPKTPAHAVVHQWQTLSSLCLSRWSGRAHVPISYSEASWTGLMDFRTCEWDKEALRYLSNECVASLPPLMDCSDTDAVRGGIAEYRLDHTEMKNAYWIRWPELRGSRTSDDDDNGSDASVCHLFLGIGDGACANVGSKCSTSSRVAVTIGTSAAARVCLPLPLASEEKITIGEESGVTKSCSNVSYDHIDVPPGLFCYRVDKFHVLLGGALTDGGSVVEWARCLLNLKDDRAFEECMQSVAQLEEEIDQCGENENNVEIISQSEKLKVLPFLSGERSTGWRDAANGCVVGLTRETTPVLFLRSCLEGVTLRIGAILHLIDNALSLSLQPPPIMGSTEKKISRTTLMENGITTSDENSKERIILASGNALEKNGVWRQMIANCANKSVVMDSEVNESTSRGAARIFAAAIMMKKYQNNNDSTRWLGEEKISALEVAEPKLNRCHWRKATDAQNETIEAVSKLWR